MTKKVSADTVKNVAFNLGTSMTAAPVILASLSREGLETAMQRFPDHRGRLVRQANILRERQLLDIPDLDMQPFETSGYLWTITPPAGFENFQVVAHDRDTQRSHLRVTFIAHDVGVGWDNWHSKSKPKEPYDIENDPVLRVAVARAICPVACAYLEKILRERPGMSSRYNPYLRHVCRHILSVRNTIPNLNLKVRRSPHLQGGDASKLLVTVTFSATFEVVLYGRSDGHTFDGVDIEQDPAYFEVVGGVTTILDAASKVKDGESKAKLEKLAADIQEKVEADTAPQRRRRQKQKELSPNVGGPGEIITLEQGGEAPMSIEVIGPQMPISVKEAAVQETLGEVQKWWNTNTDLIKPNIKEIATRTLHAYGEASPSDIDTLVNLAVPTLNAIAKKRMSQFEVFGFDAAVVGLAQMLRQEFTSRLR